MHQVLPAVFVAALIIVAVFGVGQFLLVLTDYPTIPGMARFARFLDFHIGLKKLKLQAENTTLFGLVILALTSLSLYGLKTLGFVAVIAFVFQVLPLAFRVCCHLGSDHKDDNR